MCIGTHISRWVCVCACVSFAVTRAQSVRLPKRTKCSNTDNNVCEYVCKCVSMRMCTTIYLTCAYEVLAHCVHVCWLRFHLVSCSKCTYEYNNIRLYYMFFILRVSAEWRIVGCAAHAAACLQTCTYI